jgi:hypothetical protein
MPAHWWVRLLVFQLAGYLLVGRTFGYVGVAPAKIFIGEIVLVGFLLLRPKDLAVRFLNALFGKNPMSGIACAMAVFLIYGVAQAARGVALDYPALVAAQNLVFNYYPFYLFLGVWLGLERPGLLERFVPWMGWAHGIYGLAYVLVLNNVHTLLPGVYGVRLFGQPNASPILIILLGTMPGGLWKRWAPLVLNILTLIGIQVRAEWLSLLAAIAVWAIVTRRFTSLAVRMMAALAVFGVLFVTDVTIPGAPDRGGDTSARRVIGRALSSLDPETASEFADNARGSAETVSWRTQWWRAIWNEVEQTPETSAFGLAYGFPLNSLANKLRAHAIRTPHSIFFYTLGHTGWVGVILFVYLLWQLIRLQLNVYRLNANPLGLMMVAQALSAALFENLFETPFGAVQFWMLSGLLAAPIAAAADHREYTASAQPLPATRW